MKHSIFEEVSFHMCLSSSRPRSIVQVNVYCDLLLWSAYWAGAVVLSTKWGAARAITTCFSSSLIHFFAFLQTFKKPILARCSTSPNLSEEQSRIRSRKNLVPDSPTTLVVESLLPVAPGPIFEPPARHRHTSKPPKRTAS